MSRLATIAAVLLLGASGAGQAAQNLERAAHLDHGPPVTEAGRIQERDGREMHREHVLLTEMREMVANGIETPQDVP